MIGAASARERLMMIGYAVTALAGVAMTAVAVADEPDSLELLVVGLTCMLTGVICGTVLHAVKAFNRPFLDGYELGWEARGEFEAHRQPPGHRAKLIVFPGGSAPSGDESASG